jgi:nicotinamidase-related amidase
LFSLIHCKDFCVRLTAIDGYNFGYDTSVIVDASRAVDEIENQKKLKEMKDKGIKLIQSSDF